MNILTEHIVGTVFLTAILYSCSVQHRPRPPVFNETFKKDDKNPFGSYAPYNHFKQMFGGRFIETNDKPFDEAWKDMKEYSTNTKYSLYVAVTKNLIANYSETEALLSFVREGNDLLIAADYIDDYLLSKLSCGEERGGETMTEAAGVMRTTGVNSPPGFNNRITGFTYYYYPFLNSFYGFDSASSRVLGVNENGEPDYLVFFLGKGRLYLHAAPRTFSNYFFLTNDNYRYLENVLSYLRPEPKNIFWDEYYKNLYKRDIKGSGRRQPGARDNNGFSSLDVIKRSPSLWPAFCLSVALLIIYILFNVKRRQRIISYIKPYANTTLVFAETVGRLYLQKRDNKNIAGKMIMHFYEFIRNKYFLDTSLPATEFKISLSKKSGVDPDITQKLFDAINSIQTAKKVTDNEVLLLNNLLENFYKNRRDGRKII